MELAFIGTSMAQSGIGDGWGHQEKTEISTKAVSVGDGHTVIIFDPENSAAWLQSDHSIELPGDP